MRLLGLDVGKSRIGVAFCDTSVGIVFPRNVINVKSEEKAIEEITKIVEQDRIDKIIVGLPLNFNSTRSNIQSYVENFVNLLKKKVKVEIEFFDERFTTKIASMMSSNSKNVDSIAAKIILEDYIKFKSQSGDLHS
jgi:putative Holliday junction resolvase